MKLVLVQPPSFDWSTPSNGLALLQAHLKAAGYRPVVLDSSMRVRKALIRRLRRPFKTHPEYHEALAKEKELSRALLRREIAALVRLKPDVAAFAALTYTEKWALEMAAGLKRRLPGCRVVFGGPQCQRKNAALDYIQDARIDAVILGEADASFVRYLRQLEAGRSRPIPGVLFKKDGRVVDGGDDIPPVDMDALPLMDFSGFSMKDYKGEVIYLNTTRSCLRRCRFCTHFLVQKSYSAMSPERTLREIEHQLETYPERRMVVFSDSLVNGDVKRLEKLADLLIGYRLERLAKRGGKADFGWTGMAILHPTTTPALLKKLAGSGCRALAYGLESGSQKVIDLMRKQFKVQDAETLVRQTREAGIQPRLYLQCGFPGETEADVDLTADFVRRNARYLDQVSVSFCELYRGSDIELNPERHGIKTPVTDRTRWESADGTNTFAVRQARCERVAAAAREAGIGVVEVYRSKLGFDNYDF